MKIYFLLVCLLASVVGYSQDWTITGIVTDNLLKPVPFANVYVNSTYIGTSTNESGKFRLNIPNKFKKVELIASFVGYKPNKIVIERNEDEYKDLAIQLEAANLMSEVKVTAKMDKDWKRKWKIFETGLMGESPFVKDCKILNPEVISLDYDETTKKVIATANEPIIIKNEAFGQKISFQMLNFESDGKLTMIAGYKFFESQLSAEEKIATKQKVNKEKAYNDSFRNFLVSLTQNKLKEAGFEAYKIVMLKEMYFGRINLANQITEGAIKPTTAPEICSWDEELQQYVLHSEFPLLVFALNRYNYTPTFGDKPFKHSQIALPNVYMSFSENGWINSPNGMIIYEYWGKEGVANLLPDDYTPSGISEKTPTETMPQIKTLSLPKTIPSTETSKAEYNKNELIKVEDEAAKDLVKLDYEVKINERDKSLPIFELLRKIPGLKVTTDKGISRIAFVENNTSITGNSDPTPALMLDGVLTDSPEQVMELLNSIRVREIKRIGAVRFGNGAVFGARGGKGTIIIETIR